jgi:hypothetical protein
MNDFVLFTVRPAGERAWGFWDDPAPQPLGVLRYDGTSYVLVVETLAGPIEVQLPDDIEDFDAAVVTAKAYLNGFAFALLSVDVYLNKIAP